MAGNFTFADLFCGAGGFTSGACEALTGMGLIPEVTAINHWQVAVNTHKANHPSSRAFPADLTSLNPRTLFRRGDLRLLVASPECFAAGAQVLTMGGLVSIECVRVGDLVLTHTGRWRRVTRCMRSAAPTVVLKGKGHSGLVTTRAHPFWSAAPGRYWRPISRRWMRTADDVDWVAAEAMPGRLWASVVDFPALPVPPVGGRGMPDTPEFWWLVGRWVADGTVRLRSKSSEITISVGAGKREYFITQVASMNTPGGGRSRGPTLRWRPRVIRTCELFETAHDGFARWLVAHFGRHAGGKRIPAWLLGAPVDIRQAFMYGYMAGDGSYDQTTGRCDVTTVSRPLAVGVKMLASSLGWSPNMSIVPEKDYVIEGRRVHGAEQYRLYWGTKKIRPQSITYLGHSWSKVKSCKATGRTQDVFNLSVEHDESYIVDGLVVHNCTHHSNAAGGRPKNEQSRATAHCVTNWLEALLPDSALVENVPEFTSWGPLLSEPLVWKRRRYEAGMADPRRKGEIYQAWLNMIRSLGYTVEARVLCAADYGDPTTRKRLIVQAQRAGRKIVWPEPTHGPGRSKPWVTARERVIDWSLEGTSIFERSRPLSPNTIRRIEVGLQKYGLAPFMASIDQLGGWRRLPAQRGSAHVHGNHQAAPSAGATIPDSGGACGFGCVPGVLRGCSAEDRVRQPRGCRVVHALLG